MADLNELLGMGFTQAELNQYMYVFNNGGKFTPSALQSYGYTPEQAKRLAYINNVCSGKVVVDSKQKMIKHLKKMFGENYRISMQDLAVSKVLNVPRAAVVANIPQQPYSIWNSNNYKGTDALYKVVDVTGQKITIETPRKPRLEYGKAKVIPGMLEIKGVRANGNAIVTFDKKYCTLCNRFIIIASLRNPEFHFGKYEILCFEGTKVYVYAANMGTRENVKYSMGNQRIYDFGIFPGDIKTKLDRVAREMFNHLHGVSTEYEPANSTYRVIEVEKQLDTESDIEV